ncbi:MAG: flavin reductase family protein [Rhodospirillaceae bacterium]|nr:flavin reductase family protein [Rhodospirillaceae bacterium]
MATVESPDPITLRRALGSFATGIAVVTGRRPDGEPFGLTASSFQSLSLDPPLVLYNAQKGAASLAFLAERPAFCVNILRRDQAWMARQFAEHRPDRFAGVAWEAGWSDCPVVEGALATFECRLWANYDGGDHVIVIGEVMRQRFVEVGDPLLYFRGSFMDGSGRDAPAQRQCTGGS